MDKTEIRAEIDKLVQKYFELNRSETQFVPGKSMVQYSGPVYNEEEVSAMFQSILDGWFGVGPKTDLLQARLKEIFGSHMVFMTNSGSSANLLMMASLCSPNFKGHLNDGDEVITTASTFPTAFNPIVQHRLVPVVVDIELGTYNINPHLIEKAIGPKTRAIEVVHTMGNPCDMKIIMDIAQKHNLYVVEDCCDALGARFNKKHVGSFGIAATTSFYVAHHMTTGEGGAIAVNDKELGHCVRSMRDWGRGCYCAGKMSLSKDGTCGKRFSKWIEGVPEVMDHKYIFTHIGYNLKPVEFQSAMGLVQIGKLPGFEKIRQRNFDILFKSFSKYEKYFILPTWSTEASPCWFAFPVTLKENVPFGRNEITQWFEKNLIQTRTLFTGNILKHPGYKNVRCRVAGPLTHSDTIMLRTFILGVYPGITDEKIKYVVQKLDEFMEKYPV